MFRDSFFKRSEMFWKHTAVLLVLPVLFSIAAIAQKPAPAPDVTAPPPAKTLPGMNDPVASSAQVDLGTYVIGANDLLNIEVFDNPQFSRVYPVRTDGILTIPLFGDMKAEGLTPLQLKKQLTEMFSDKLKDPEVSVTVWDVRSKKYTVTGSVKRPGPFPLVRTTHVFEALTDAGGFMDNFSNQKDILILRGDKTFHFSYADYLKGKNRDKNIELQNGDTIVVK